MTALVLAAAYLLLLIDGGKLGGDFGLGMLGGGQLAFRQDGAGLHFTMPHGIDFVPAVRIDGRGLV